MKFLKSLLHNRKAVAGLLILLLIVLMSYAPALFTSNGDPDTPGQFDPQLPISTAHLLGTTGLGQDTYSLLIYGARQSLQIAVIAGFFATVLSVLIGVTAAYLGGLMDDLLSLLTNVVLIIPTFPLIVILAKYAGQSNTVMIAVLVATGWSYGANQMRAQALSLRNRDFLESARVRGERRSYIILFEMLPTMSSLIVANFLGAALYSVGAAAGLQFLGLGDQSHDSWGQMLYWAQNREALEAGSPLWAIAPGVLIAVLGASFALINYAFDEIGNPALRPVRRKDLRAAAKANKTPKEGADRALVDAA